jgi:hypothetical protein
MGIVYVIGISSWLSQLEILAISGIENALAKLDENKIPQYSFPESSARAIVAMQ